MLDFSTYDAIETGAISVQAGPRRATIKNPPETAMQRAASLVRKLKLPAGSDSPEERAKAAWRIACGPKIERHTIAASLVRNTLVVEVGDIIWQRQLNTLRHFLLRNLADVLGEPLVTDLDFRPMPPRRKPANEVSARPQAGSHGIGDPVLALLYRESEKRQA